MFRYLALTWRPGDREQVCAATDLEQRVRAISTEWQQVYSCEGMVVFCAGAVRGASEWRLLSDAAGVVVGTVFDKRDVAEGIAPGKAAFGPNETRAIVSTRGRRLIESCWGRYVAFLADVASGRRWVVRDPTGDLPCCCIAHRGVLVVFSRVADCIALRVERFSVDRQRVIRRVAWHLAEQESAISEIETLRPGECLELADDGESTAVYWDPFAIARSGPIESIDDAAAGLRNVAKACIHAWASCYERVILELSGGLDSSIVLGCLRDAPGGPQITALNLRTRDRCSDERPYARLAALRAGCELIEQERSTSIDLREILRFAPSISPQNLVMQSIEVNPVLRRLAVSRGAGAIFTGDGGDSVFGRGRARLSVIDYFLDRGLSCNLIRFAWDVSLLVQASVWELLAEAFCYRFLRRPDLLKDLLVTRVLIAAEVAKGAAKQTDWLPQAFRSATAPPGLFMYALGVVHPHVFYDPLGQADDPELVTPLTAQPIVEYCLRIPPYVHVDGGKERAVARRAFEADVPPEIIGRFWKGGVERHFRELLVRNIEFARELLLDGYLVNEGILDRGRVADVLSRDPTTVAGYTSEIFDHVCTEAWVRQWLSLPREVSA